MAPRTLLLIDDTGENRQTVRNILGGDYEILEAENGREAVGLLERLAPGISAVLSDLDMPVMDGFELLGYMRGSAELAQIPVIVATDRADEACVARALTLGADDYVTRPCEPTILRQRVRNAISLHESAIAVRELQRDPLTGLYNRETFLHKAEELIAAAEPGSYVMACFDIDNFKVVNDQYSIAMGDEVLRHVASSISALISPLGGLCCRVMADNFAILYPSSLLGTGKLEENHRLATAPACIGRPISIRVGRYVVTDLSLSASAMYDRATLAELSVRGRYDQYIAQYDERMREHLLREQRIVGDMDEALRSGQFEPWFQPQYNHATGALVGAEALVRWRHPSDGLLVPPGDFIPVFERNGFIYEMDKNIWEQVCILLRGWIDRGLNPLPLSVNISRYDLLREDFYSVITGLTKKYSIPVELLRLEITESAFAKSGERIISTVRQLVEYGFTVEIDDFGSGYSSLNTLKDVPASILKLDMRFLESTGDVQRGGNILESVVRMAKWLGMSVIGEGVETRQQADYLKSIGCYYVQGYYYARPMPLADYEALSVGSVKEREMIHLETVETLDNNSFWDPLSMDTLIFNSYVGGACIFEFHNGVEELLRVNDKYAETFGSGISAEEIFSTSILEHMDEENRELTRQNILRAIETGQESTCETVIKGLNGAAGPIHIRSTVRVLARAGDRYLCYSTVINMTAEKEAERELREADELLRFLNDTAHDLLAQSNSEKCMEIVLHKLLDYFDGDRAYVFEIDRSRQTASNTYEVCAPGVSPEIENLRAIPLSSCSAWLDAFRDEGYMSISRPAELPEDRPDRRILLEQNVDSLLAVPLRRDGELIGCIGVDTPRRQQNRAANLNALGDYIAVLLTRRDLDSRIRRDTSSLLSLMNDSPGGFARLRVKEDGLLEPVYANDGFCRLVGMSREELSKKYGGDSLAGVHPDDLLAIRRAVELVLRQGEVRNVRYRLINGRGKYVWLLSFGRMTHGDNGETFLNIYHTNASERDKLEEQRRELLENLPCGAGIYEITGGDIRAVYLNRRYRNFLHREIGELSQAPVMEMVHPDDRSKLSRQLRAAMQSGSQESCDIRIMDGQGGYLPFKVIGTVAERSEVRSVIYVTYTPITKEELTARETLPFILSAVMKSTSDLSFAKDRELRYICCSQSFAEMVGREDERDILGKTDYDIFPRELADKFRKDDLRLLRDGNSIVDMVEPILSDDDAAHYSSTSKYLLYDSVGNVIGLYGSGRDITEYRAAFERLRLLTNSIPGGLATYDLGPDGMRLQYFTDGYCTHTGYTREEYLELARNSPLCLVFEEDLPIVESSVAEILAGASSFSYEYRASCKDGGYRWLNTQGVVTERRGDHAMVNVVKLDVTERRLSEERLRTREEQYRLAQRQSGSLIFRYDISSRTAYADVGPGEEAAGIYIDPEHPVSLIPGISLLPDSLEDYRAAFDAIVQGGPDGASKLHMRSDDDSIHWLELRYSIVRPQHGAPRSAVLSLRDITDAHEKELAYRRFLESVRDDARNERVMYFDTDLTADVVESAGGSIPNVSFPEVGCRHEDATGYGISSLLLPDYRVRGQAFFSREHLITAFADGVRNLSEDWPVTIGDGPERWFRSTIQMMQDPYSGHLRAYTSLHDITEEKCSQLDTLKRSQMDGLTGIYNRATAEALIRERLRSSDGRPCTLIIADLDDLKSINDTLGHPQGDRAIRLIAAALKSRFRSGDLVGRIGGDEFLVFLDGSVERDRLEKLLGSFITSLSAARIGDNNDTPFLASLGATVGHTGRDSFELLYQQADKALYHAKRNGKKQFAFYSPEMD